MTDAAPLATAVPLDKPLYGATPVQAVSRYFRKYAVFSGRASRSEFWWARLFVFLVQVVIWIPGIILGIATGHREISATTGQPTFIPGLALGAFFLISILVSLGLLVADISSGVRRLHDANFPGGLYAIAFLGGLGALVITVLCVMESKPEGARYDLDAVQAMPPVLPPPPAPPVAPPPAG
jgi:uncharacterized membrane protein YhaH (DUF805 family)